MPLKVTGTLSHNCYCRLSQCHTMWNISDNSNSHQHFIYMQKIIHCVISGIVLPITVCAVHIRWNFHKIWRDCHCVIIQSDARNDQWNDIYQICLMACRLRHILQIYKICIWFEIITEKKTERHSVRVFWFWNFFNFFCQNNDNDSFYEEFF